MGRLLFLLFTIAAIWPGGEYVDPTGSFSLTVPAGYRVRTGPEKGSDSYIPVCHAESSVCFEYPAQRFPGTTFESASVEVTVLTGKTDKACMDAAMYAIPEQNDSANGRGVRRPPRVIDGVKFRHIVSGGAAMSHDVDSDVYWGFDRGKCFELTAAVTYTNFFVYDPGQIKEFTSRNKAKVTAELNRIIATFRHFSSPGR